MKKTGVYVCVSSLNATKGGAFGAFGTQNSEELQVQQPLLAAETVSKWLLCLDDGPTEAPLKPAGAGCFALTKNLLQVPTTKTP